MCGIAGVYRPRGLSDPKAAEAGLLRAAESFAYRGPDASGSLLLAGHGLGLAHRRLAILDLDARANQPMSSPDGRFHLTYNGEIYNFKELRAELQKGGAEFKTAGDAEVLLEGCRAWGMETLLSKCAGMFAFALYDAQERRLFLARDRAGKKPLFYAGTPDSSQGLVFASEMRGLLELLPEARELDPAGFDAYLHLKFSPSPSTLFKGVRKLPPGHYLVLQEGRELRPRRYWDPFPRENSNGYPGGACSGGVGAALDLAVKRRLVSDVPVCLFLSGGVDSGLIAEALSRLAPEGTRAYSIGYRDLPAYSEFDHARLNAAGRRLDYREILLDSAEARGLLEDSSLILDEPVSDWAWVPLYQLSRRAHEDGFKVVLLGEGSDEIFFGYDVMEKGLRAVRLFANPIARAAAVAAARLLAPVYRVSRKGHRRYDLWRRLADGEPLYLGGSIGFGASQRHQAAGPRLLESGDPAAGVRALAAIHARYAQRAPDPSDEVNLICYVEFMTKMTETLLQRVDRVSMLHSLEARSPFLDQDLVEAAFSLPGPLKLRGGLKGALKTYARTRLHPDVVDRPKMGFSFPFKEWLRGDLGGFVEETYAGASLFKDGWLKSGFARALLAEHRAGLFDHAPRTWMLFTLCRWYEKWIKGRA